MALRKIVTVMVVVNVSNALAHNTLDNHIYLYDNNRKNGSTHEGTDHLISVVDFEDGKIADPPIEIRWDIMALEPEAFVELSRVRMNEEYVNVSQKLYKGSDIKYWHGKINKPFDKVTCEIFVKLGSHKQEFCHSFDFVGIKNGNDGNG